MEIEPVTVYIVYYICTHCHSLREIFKGKNESRGQA